MKFFKKHPIFTFAIVIFLLAFSLRIWNLNKMGQVWDEAEFLQYAHKHVELAQKLDFTNDFWWKKDPDHPPLTRYLRGIASLPDIDHYEKSGKPVFKYDLTYNRLLSVILTSLAAVIVFLFGARFISLFTGVASGIIFSMLPILLGHSQIGMLEPVAIFFFTLSIYAFASHLNNQTGKKLVLAGVALGFAVLARETHVMLMPMYLIILYFFKMKHRKTSFKKLLKQTFFIFLIAFIVFFAFWPMPFFHLGYMFEYTYRLRATVSTSIPEVFFGRLMLVPVTYYFVHVLITTPLLILILALFGLKRIDKSKNWILYTVILWFCFPFLMSFYPKREQGIRYIIQICAPLSLLAGYGFEKIALHITKQKLKQYLLLLPLFLYMFIILLRITPYYLDYFNILVGGAKNVYEKRLFHLAWWGQGNKEAGLYILKHAKKDSRVGIATSPSHNFPPMTGMNVTLYEDSKTYDYVIVNFYHVTRIGFNDSLIRKKYKVVYSVLADGAHLVDIYAPK